MINEIWKPAPGYEHGYEVSNQNTHQRREYTKGAVNPFCISICLRTDN